MASNYRSFNFYYYGGLLFYLDMLINKYIKKERKSYINNLQYSWSQYTKPLTVSFELMNYSSLQCMAV